MAFNSTTLAIARASRQQSLTQLSKMTEISVSILSRIEAGQREPTAIELSRLAEALEYPESMFSATLPTGGIGLAGMYHRKLKSARVRDVKKVESDCLLATIAMKRLTRWYEFDSEFQFPDLEPEDFGGDPVKAAGMMRLQWQLPRGPIKDVVSAIERAGGVVIESEFDIKSMDALFQFAPGIPPLFWINRAKPADRVRFSLAHELGHSIMHRQVTPSDRAEDEANAFASAFLMPKSEFLASLPGRITLSSLLDLKPYWRVSAAAMAMRAKQLGALTESQHRYLMIQVSRAGWRLEEPEPIAPTQPKSLVKALTSVMRLNDWSRSELAAALCMPFEVVDAWLGDHPFSNLGDPGSSDSWPPLRLA